MADELLLTTGQAQARLRLGRSTVFSLIKTGQLESVKIGRARRIPEAALREYVEKLRATA